MGIDLMTKANTKIIISGIKDTLKSGFLKWKDTGAIISYDELLNVFEINEPLSYEEAKRMYSSLSNDSRIKRQINVFPNVSSAMLVT